jgi:hypothetical protein
MGLAAIPVAFALMRRERGGRREHRGRFWRQDDVLATVPSQDPAAVTSG